MGKERFESVNWHLMMGLDSELPTFALDAFCFVGDC